MVRTSILVDADDLIIALESDGAELEWYLDLASGQVLPLFGDACSDDDLAAALEAEPDRYFRVEPMGSPQAFRIMEAFVDTLPESAESERLEAALRQSRPFRHFKDSLAAWPPIREQWFRFHDARMRQVAEAWITGNEFEVRLTPATDPGPQA